MASLESDRILSKRRVIDLTSLSATSIWRLVRQEKFPKPVKLSAGRVGWSENAVRSWIAARLDPAA